jgi:hypothetical protein
MDYVLFYDNPIEQIAQLNQTRLKRSTDDDGYKRFTYPKFFRNVQETLAGDKDPDSSEVFMDSLGPLLENSLTLMQWAVSWRGDFCNEFLNVEISDSDTPWDIAETDW